jgi:diguanylate cyclase (GGDEF)-like protein
MQELLSGLSANTRGDDAKLNSFRTLGRPSPIRWLILCGVLLIASIVIGTAVMIDNFRERALSSSESELENTVLLLARHFDQQMEDLGIAETEVVAQIHTGGIASSEELRRRMSGFETHEMLKAKISGLSYVGTLNLFDADGAMINSSGTWPAASVNISNQSYFKALKSDKNFQLFLSEPIKNHDTGAWTIVLARRLSGPDDEFLGVIGRVIEPEQFESFFGSVAEKTDAAVSMHHKSGILLARYPHVEEMIGRNFKTGPTNQQRLFDVDHGTARLASPVDGRDRLVAARQLSKFPIVLVAATTVSAALADWREQTRFMTCMAALAALVTAIILFLIVRQLSRQHRNSEQRLTLEKQRLDTAINNLTQGLLLFDSSAHLVTCNERYMEMFGASPDVVKPGCTVYELIRHRKDKGAFSGDVEEYCSKVLSDVRQRKTVQGKLATNDGRSIQVVYRPLADGGWVTTLEDVTERTRAEERITHLAQYDALTDLPNRVLFREQLETESRRVQRDGKFAVFYIDIDEFKSINDSLGHQVGDELLKSVAQRMRGCIRSTDFVARLGGDEFAVIQTSVKNSSDITDVVMKIHSAIREPHQCLGHELITDASIGIAIAPDDGVDLDQLLKNADLAMYGAKADGRRTYRFFEPEMDARVKTRCALEQDLRQAITGGKFAEGGFEVYYQPIVSLSNNKVTGCEALLRWHHPHLGQISPAEFIPVAEESGLISQLGEWVLMTACAEAATWDKYISIAVNVSPVQFRSRTLALKVAAALTASGLAPSRLELEITEAVLIRDDEAALAMLHQLRAIGVRIALDDFGTGYSSLSYLQRFPFDKIKVDRCFVKDILENDGSSSIVQAVVNIAAARNMTTTAEGVETEVQREVLRRLGCTEMQGYLFSPAKPAQDIRRLVLSGANRNAFAA